MLETSDDRLSGFRTYYDTAAFLLARPGRADVETSGSGSSSQAATSDYTARDSGFLDEDTRLGGRAH